MRLLAGIASLVAAVGCVFVVALVLAIRFIHVAAPGAPARGMAAVQSLLSPTDTISLWFSALGIMIGLASLIVTAVGLGIGGLAIVGYKTFQEEVKRRVSEAAEVEMGKFLGGPRFETQLEANVKKHISTKYWESGTFAGQKELTRELTVRKYPKRSKNEG